jgi:hypothetical protein
MRCPTRPQTRFGATLIFGNDRLLGPGLLRVQPRRRSRSIDFHIADLGGNTLDPPSPSHLMIVDNASDRVYQFDNAVSRTSGSQSPSTSFALAAGNTNPQGIADPPVSGDAAPYFPGPAIPREWDAGPIALSMSGSRRAQCVVELVPERSEEPDTVRPARLLTTEEPRLPGPRREDEPQFCSRQAVDEALLDVLEEWKPGRRDASE